MCLFTPEGGYPVLPMEGEYPIPGQDGEWVPIPDQDRGVPSYQVRMVGGGYLHPAHQGSTTITGQDRSSPPPHSDLAWGYISRMDGDTAPLPCQVTCQDVVYPQPEQHSEHTLRDGRYASYVHAGGPSCKNFFFQKASKYTIFCTYVIRVMWDKCQSCLCYEH